MLFSKFEVHIRVSNSYQVNTLFSQQQPFKRVLKFKKKTTQSVHSAVYVYFIIAPTSTENVNYNITQNNNSSSMLVYKVITDCYGYENIKLH